ncbi:MAG TPA: DNA mismatch repair endonuclease MutL [Firmicutes bacterium]|nr:DNA mismatch repair endonuclease MutL [Bacillota bacterium]
MIAKIALLDEITINQIAAGEVVERPSSVVKELMENSIDAGAKKIEVYLLNGGRQKIQVVDDGSGMEREDALLALERHATSKIRTFADLKRSYTLGFRGEALSSIASVSRTTLQTAANSGSPGSKILVEGGIFRSTETVGVPSGTNIIVEDLFFNTPARLKFMRSIPSEVGSVKEVVTSMALGYPEISFRLVHQNMELIHTLGTGDYLQTLEQIFSAAICKDLCPVEGDYGPLRLTGFIGRPNIARGNRGQQYFFLNRRLFRSRLIAAAAEKAYDTLLPVARFPFLVLNIEIPLELVDINVHPTKMEVKFKDEKEVFRGVLAIIRSGLNAHVIDSPWIPRYQTPDFLVKEATDRSRTSSFLPLKTMEEAAVKDGFGQKELIPNKAVSALHQPQQSVEEVSVETSFSLEPSTESGEEDLANGIFKLFDTYLLWEDSSDLVLIDQHAAHERIIYDRLSHNQNQKMQYFLTPLSIELSVEQLSTAQEKGEILQELGWEFEEFGGEAVLLRSGPQGFSVEQVEDLFISLLDELGSKESNQEGNPKERLLKIMACRQAVKAGDQLTGREAAALIRNLRKTTVPQTCPHGRPTMVAISKEEIEKMFKRR